MKPVPPCHLFRNREGWLLACAEYRYRKAVAARRRFWLWLWLRLALCVLAVAGCFLWLYSCFYLPL